MSEILIEAVDVDNSDVTIVEDVRDGQRIMKFRGTLSEADKLNKNRRIYPKKVLKEAFDEAKQRIEAGDKIIGEMEHAADAKVRLANICVVFEELEWDDVNGKIVGTAVPVENDPGKNIMALAKAGLKICFSTRCSGKTKDYNGPLSEGALGVKEVLPGLRIVSIDVVANPSCQNAKTETVYEETISECCSTMVTGKTLIDNIF